MGRTAGAAAAYARALELTENGAEREFLARQLEDLRANPGTAEAASGS